METPKRIQRKRTKGWKIPPNTVNCTRPGKWGNPFKVGNYYTISKSGWMTPCTPEAIELAKKSPRYIFIVDAQCAVDTYESYMKNLMFPYDFTELRGKNLACFCKEGQPCHADILLKLANA